MRNMYGCDIKPCCASCQHREITKLGRTCGKDHTDVPSDYMCSEWQMAEGLNNAGRGGSVVRDIMTKEVILQ